MVCCLQYDNRDFGIRIFYKEKGSYYKEMQNILNYLEAIKEITFPWGVGAKWAMPQ